MRTFTNLALSLVWSGLSTSSSSGGDGISRTGELID